MDILHADASLLVVNKPPGLATNPGGWVEESPSLVEILTAVYGRIWIVHRLDKGTSGLVLFARNAEAHRSLSMQFEHHQARKIYHAVVVGEPAWDEHTARHPLRINVGHSHRTVVDHAKGRPCETAFHVAERYHGYALLTAAPATGRTHQVRVHASALGLPLLGDHLYGAPATSLINRPALHAWSIEFSLEGQPFQFNAPHPPDFIKALESVHSLPSFR
jgi:RluA family pseudouridine synthase